MVRLAECLQQEKNLTSEISFDWTINVLVHAVPAQNEMHM